MEKNRQSPTNFARFAETLFDEIFEDYAQTSDQWLDFEDYRRRAIDRMHAIVARHSRKVVTLVMDEHYRKV
jgi:hypothetical protein